MEVPDVNLFIQIYWDGQGTSYTTGKDKMYGLGPVSKAECGTAEVLEDIKVG